MHYPLLQQNRSEAPSPTPPPSALATRRAEKERGRNVLLLPFSRSDGGEGATPARHPSHSRRGTSLIEVLVVLVVLVVGVLAIARLFPAGFLSLRGAENNSYAGRLAQGALDVLKQNNASLADGVYMYRSDTQAFDPTYTPDNLKPFSANTAYSDINKARYISNETVIVPAARSGVNYGLYALNFGPFEPNTLTVNGTLWTAKNADSRRDASGLATDTLDNPVDILQPGQQAFLVDLNAGQIAVPPAAYPQTFVLTVTKKIAGTQTVTFTVPANTAATPYAGTWFNVMGAVNLPDVGTTTTPDFWQTAELYRPYNDLTPNPANPTIVPTFTADPYEYALFNPNTAIPGMQTLAFNSLAGGRVGISPLQARLSYSTQDWHILHEDRDVPDGGGTLRLALSGLKKSGDVQFDQTLFNGLGTSGNDIYILDRDDGTFYGLTGSGTGQNVTNTDDNSAPTTPIASVSYLNGRITLPASFSGKHLRIFYAGTADWAVAVQKAPKFYTKAASLAAVKTPSVQTPNQYYLDVAGSQIAFPRCDAGKMVQITISSYSDTAATGGKSYGGQPPLSMPITDKLDTSGVQFMDVSSLLPSTGTIDPTSVKITITGLSARALVIWHERDQWKTRSIDTLLTHIE